MKWHRSSLKARNQCSRGCHAAPACQRQEGTSWNNVGVLRSCQPTMSVISKLNKFQNQIIVYCIHVYTYTHLSASTLSCKILLSVAVYFVPLDLAPLSNLLRSSAETKAMKAMNDSCCSTCADGRSSQAPDESRYWRQT